MIGSNDYLRRWNKNEEEHRKEEDSRNKHIEATMEERRERGEHDNERRTEIEERREENQQ